MHEATGGRNNHVKHVCHRCDKSFTAKSALNRHMLGHSRDKVHQCTGKISSIEAN